MNLILVILLLYFPYYIKGQDSSNVTLNEDWSYCLEYTWMGPDYNNFTLYNATCSEYLDETRAVNVPCSSPLVISDDGTKPNMTWLWENKRNSILCIQSQNKVCARYTYIYNGQIHNVTYMCTKVQHVGVGSITNGCYKQKYEGFETEVCVCQNGKGLRSLPCNGAVRHEIIYYSIFIGFFAIVVNKVLLFN